MAKLNGYVKRVSGSYAYVSPTNNSSEYQFGSRDVLSGDWAKISYGDYVSFEISGNRAKNVRIMHDKK